MPSMTPAYVFVFTALVAAGPSKPPDASKSTPTNRPKVTKPAQSVHSAPVDPRAALLDQVQKYYDATKDFSAEFTQTYTRVALSRTLESSGVVMIKKPGMMRWEYEKPAKKSFVADGKQLFIYEPEEEQVIIDPHFEASELGSSLSFLWGKGRLTDSFRSSLGDPSGIDAPSGTKVLELIPLTDRTYSKLLLLIDPKSGRVIESILHETSGNTNRFRFKNPRINSGLKDDAFRFVPPIGAEIVRRP